MLTKEELEKLKADHRFDPRYSCGCDVCRLFDHIAEQEKAIERLTNELIRWGERFDDGDDEEPCCPDCDGDVRCGEDGIWRCVQGIGREIGCGWSGDEPKYK